MKKQTNDRATAADACRDLGFGPTKDIKNGTVSSAIKKGNDLRVKGGK